MRTRTSCGAPMAIRVFDGATTAAIRWIFDRRRAIGTPSVPAGLSASAATASPPCSRSRGKPGACRAVWRDRGRRGSGAGLADARSRLPVSVGPLHQPPSRPALGSAVKCYAARSRLEGPANGASNRSTMRLQNRTLKEHAGALGHPWSHLPIQHRGAASRRPRLRLGTLTMRRDGRKSTYSMSEPPSAASRQASHSAIRNQARRVRQTCVQGTGCATPCGLPTTARARSTTATNCVIRAT